jgi:phage repressor protein C with HTH and peptisase S24 domain
MNAIHDRISLRIRELNLKQADIVTRTGVSRGGVSAWVSGRNTPTGDNLEKLARALECSSQWLMFGGDSPKSINNTSLNFDSSPLGEMPSYNFIEVPVYNAELSAGFGSSVESSEVIEFYPIHDQLLSKLNISPNTAAIVRVRGDSMEETLWSGDSILVNTSIKKPTSGNIFAFEVEGELKVKRFERKIDTTWRIISDNMDKASFPDEIIAPQTLDSLNVLGHVVRVVDRKL